MHSRTLFIDRIPRTFVDEAALYALCDVPKGQLEFCQVAYSSGRSNSGKCRGFALCDYATCEDAEKAYDMINGASLGTTVIRVAFANPAKLGSQIFMTNKESTKHRTQQYSGPTATQPVPLRQRSSAKILPTRTSSKMLTIAHGTSGNLMGARSNACMTAPHSRAETGSLLPVPPTMINAQLPPPPHPHGNQMARKPSLLALNPHLPMPTNTLPPPSYQSHQLPPPPMAPHYPSSYQTSYQNSYQASYQASYQSFPGCSTSNMAPNMHVPTSLAPPTLVPDSYERYGHASQSTLAPLPTLPPTSTVHGIPPYQPFVPGTQACQSAGTYARDLTQTLQHAPHTGAPAKVPLYHPPPTAYSKGHGRYPDANSENQPSLCTAVGTGHSARVHGPDDVIPTMQSSPKSLFARKQQHVRRPVAYTAGRAAVSPPKGRVVLQRKRSYGRLQHTQGLGVSLSLTNITNLNTASALSDLVSTYCLNTDKDNGNDGGDTASDARTVHPKHATLLTFHRA
eukprot:m.94733 g.94733  ORF g.94733 m.94733 type:complete len:510 (+) comp16566_c0_seq1:353-1882(+)